MVQVQREVDRLSKWTPQVNFGGRLARMIAITALICVICYESVCLFWTSEPSDFIEAGVYLGEKTKSDFN